MLKSLPIVIFVAMAPIQLECAVVDCQFGDAGAKYKTPALEAEIALQLLNIHRQDTHRLGQGGQQQQEQPGDASRSKVEKVPRPSLQKGQSEDKYLHFKRQWVRYKRSTGLVSEVMIRDQLLACCSEELSEDLGNLYGEQLDNKDEATLLEEMHKLAVVAQNHLVNILRLRSMVQDRDESARSYLARLKGAVTVCKLTMNCSCVPSTSVSFADKEILHCLVKGLVDEDIRKQVLGVVVEMDLENTVKFVEAKESGKKAGVYLDGGEVDVNKVTGYKQAQREQQLAGRTNTDVLVDEARCKYCGKKGHGAAPGFSKKKEECPAFDKKCNSCGVVGHFSRTKSCKKSSVKVEKVVVQHEKDTKDRVGVRQWQQLEICMVRLSSCPCPSPFPI